MKLDIQHLTILTKNLVKRENTEMIDKEKIESEGIETLEEEKEGHA